MYNPAVETPAIVEAIYPKAVANYLSKLPDFQEVHYPVLLDAMLETERPLESRLHDAAALVGKLTLEPEVEAEIGYLYSAITDHEEGIDAPERQAVIRTSDHNQDRDRVSPRSLHYFMHNGLAVVVQDTALEVANRQLEITGAAGLPLLEQLKAERLFTVNGFADSRVIHLLHDVLDHPWLFTQLESAGVFSKYASFLDSVDMVDTSFLYSRQAELIASVGFGSRRWQLAKTQDEPMVLTDGHIEHILGTASDDTCEQAWDAYSDLEDEPRQWIRFVIENMALQIADERRRYGGVKQADTLGQKHPMRLLDPTYIAFLIDSTITVQRSPSFINAQVQGAMIVEGILEATMDGQYGHGEIITVFPPKPEEQTGIETNSEKVGWFSDNLGRITAYSN